MTPRVSVRGLSKAFHRASATRTKGISSEGPAALKHLLKHVARPTRSIVSEGSGRYLMALDDVSFDVAPGEVLGIIGRNGAGKSTLLKILARVLYPTSGQATIRGRLVSMLELGVGFAPDLTLRQNIQVHGRLAGISPARIAAAEDDILQLSGLADYANLPLEACPGGGAIQLGFAAVICLGADVVLADEVLAVGDSEFRKACEDRVRDAAGSGESVLFVSHDMAAIRRICSRVIWIDRGRIVREGPTEDVVEAYTEALLGGRLLPAPAGDGVAANCVLLDVRLLDVNRAQVGALQLTEPGYIDCLFRVTRPDLSVIVDIELWNRKCLVFATSSAPVTAKDPTTFRAGVRIPEDVLNESQYRATFRLRATGFHNGALMTVVAVEEKLDFAAMNPHPERSVWRDWQWGRGGLISPRLQWHLEPPERGVDAAHA